MSKKPSKPKATKPILPREKKPTIVLFGLDEKDNPRGARFVGEDEALMTRMAQAMGLRMGAPHAPHQLLVTNKLPRGDVHATGLKAVPQIPLELYEKLNALVGGETGAISTVHPESWEAIEPGHLVVAQDTLMDGWWPAVVVKRHENSLVLRWRDFPGQGEAIRDINSVALLKND